MRLHATGDRRAILDGARASYVDAFLRSVPSPSPNYCASIYQAPTSDEALYREATNFPPCA